MIAKTLTGQISFFEAGADQSLPVLLLLPGLFCSARRLLEALLPLANKTRLVAVEWRGHGLSAAPEGFLIQDLAGDVMAIIRSQLAGQRLCILGHSVGARVLWSLMNAFKSELEPLVDGIAIIDQGPQASTGKTRNGELDFNHETLKQDSEQIASGRSGMISTLQRLWGDEGCGFLPSQSEMMEWLEFARSCDPRATSSLHWDALTKDYSRVARSIGTKVLLMVGDSTLGHQSLGGSEIYQRMGASVPSSGAHFSLFQGGTHCLHQQPDQLHKLICLLERFLHGQLEVNVYPGRLESIPKYATEMATLSRSHLTSTPVIQKQFSICVSNAPRRTKCSPRRRRAIGMHPLCGQTRSCHILRPP
jgi:pimeloyl-ACP methyl ester carboxylesterase